MSILRKAAVPVNDTEKALVLHSSSYRAQPMLPVPTAPPQLQDPQAAEIDLFDSLRRHWLLATVLFSVIAVVGTLYCLSTMHPNYQAETTIYVSPELARETGTSGVTDSTYATFLNQQIMTILHYDTLSEAVQQLKKKGIHWKNTGETERASVDRLRGALSVQHVPDSYELAIQMTGANPGMVAAVANAVAQSFLEEANAPEASGRVDKGSALQREKVALQKEIQDQQDIRANLAVSLQTANPRGNSPLPDDETLSQLHASLAMAHSKRVEAQAQLEAGQSTLTSDAQQIAKNDPAAQTVRTGLLQKQLQLREQIKNMLPTHPFRKQAEAELAAIDSELRNGSSDQVTKVSGDIQAKLQAQVDEYRKMEYVLSRDIAIKLAGLPAISRNLALAEQTSGEIQRLQDQLTRVDTQMEEIRLRNTSGAAMRVFSIAQAPTVPVKSQQMKAIGAVFAAALLLGIGLPLALDIRDARIYDPATIERILGFPIVGMTIERTPKTETFADEHLRRIVSGIERGIAEGARSVLLTGIKQTVEPSLIRDISRHLSDHKINVTVRMNRRNIETEYRTAAQTRIVGPGVSMSDDMEDCEVVLMDSPALVFSADAERMAAKADMTLVVVKAGMNTRPDLVRGARLLERLNVPAVGVILQDVKVERAGRVLRRDLKEYTALQAQMGRLTRNWDGNAFV